MALLQPCPVQGPVQNLYYTIAFIARVIPLKYILGLLCCYRFLADGGRGVDSGGAAPLDLREHPGQVELRPRLHPRYAPAAAAAFVCRDPLYLCLVTLTVLLTGAPKATAAPKGPATQQQRERTAQRVLALFTGTICTSRSIHVFT